jgi:hypothetical protein
MATRLTIAYTINNFLTIYHPFIPWLAIRQNNRLQLRIGQDIEIELAYGLPFRDQEMHLYGHIHGISHYVQGFVIVIVNMDPQVFPSAIYIAIPCQWFNLPFLSAISYRISHRTLPIPGFNHLLDPTHMIHQSDVLAEVIEGSRTCRRPR